MFYFEKKSTKMDIITKKKKNLMHKEIKSVYQNIFQVRNFKIMVS